jgi:hypothetical protein
MTMREQTWMGFPIAEASPQAIIWAKRYGRRIECADSGTTVVAYQWGNHVYIDSFHQDGELKQERT